METLFECRRAEPSQAQHSTAQPIRMRRPARKGETGNNKNEINEIKFELCACVYVSHGTKTIFQRCFKHCALCVFSLVSMNRDVHSLCVHGYCCCCCCCLNICCCYCCCGGNVHGNSHFTFHTTYQTRKHI